EMGDSHGRRLASPGERLRRAQPDEQRPGQSRPTRDSHLLYSVEAFPGLGERLVDRRDDELEMPAGRDLRHDAAKAGMQVGLGRDDVREDAAVLGYERGRGLVTGRLQAENQDTTRSPTPP